MKRPSHPQKGSTRFQPSPPWTAEETRVLDQHVRMVLEGKLASPRQAVKFCLPLLDRIRMERSTGYVRTWEATYRALLQRIPKRFRHRYRRPPSWTPAEMRVVDRCSQAVADGKYESAAAAAEACFFELERVWRRAQKAGDTGSIRRSRTATYGRLRERVREMGIRADWSHSSPEERKVVMEWVERYWQTREVKPPFFIVDLADLLRAELKQRGYERSPGFCERALARRIRLSRRARELARAETPAARLT